MTSPANEIEIEQPSTRISTAEIPTQYQIQLNDNEELISKLESFKSDCKYLEATRKKSCKQRYYELALIARITTKTRDEELMNLLLNGTLTFLFDTVTTKPEELRDLMFRTVTAIDAFQSEQPRKQIISNLAFEINGDSCRLGRLRNDCSIMLNHSDIITLTTDESYANSGYKEVNYVRNLKYYLKGLQLRDAVKIGDEAIGCVVKILSVSIAVQIVKPGLINNYEFISFPKQCTKCAPADLISMFQADLEWVSGLGANFIVLPKLRCKSFLETLRKVMQSDFKSLKLIGYLDLEYVHEHSLDLFDILKHLDYLWIPEYFQTNCCMQYYIGECVAPMAKYLRLPIICSMPLDCYKQFKRIVKHPFLEELDALVIQKSSFCCKYPLIVRKLMPVSKYVCFMKPDCVSTKGLTTTFQTKLNYMLAVLSTIECDAIFLNIDAAPLMEALKRVEVNSPLYVMLPWDSHTYSEEDLENILQLAHALNLRRNARAIVYTSNMNEYGYSPIGYGIDYVQRKGCINLGELIVTLEVFRNSKQVVDEANVAENAEEEAEDLSDDVAILQAFYLRRPERKWRIIDEVEE